MRRTGVGLSLMAAAFLAGAALTGCSVLGTVEAPVGGEADILALASGETEEESKDDGTSRLEEIKERGYLTVATEPYFAPNEFIDPSKSGDERYVGADIELAHYIADHLGVECRIIPLDFTAVLSSVSEGKYDMAISALAYTPARAQAMELSNGYYYDEETVWYGLLVRDEDLEDIQSADDLGDKTVVVQSGSLQEVFAQEQIPAYGELKLVSSTSDGFLMVQENKADACVTAAATAELYLEANPGCGMSMVPDFRFTVDESTQGTRIGMKKGETELRDAVNEIIDEMTEEGLYKQWYQEYSDYAASLGIN